MLRCSTFLSRAERRGKDVVAATGVSLKSISSLGHPQNSTVVLFVYTICRVLLASLNFPVKCTFESRFYKTRVLLLRASASNHHELHATYLGALQ